MKVMLAHTLGENVNHAIHLTWDTHKSNGLNMTSNGLTANFPEFTRPGLDGHFFLKKWFLRL